MHAVDEYMEQADAMMVKIFSFTIPMMPGYKNKKVLCSEFLSGYLLDLMKKMEEKFKNSGTKYLCAAYITVADLVMFAQFWKMLYNPKSDWPTEEVLDALTIN